MKRIGFVGLGEMGLPMARNVHARGFEVRGYDTRAEAQRAFRETGGRVAASAEEAAQEADAVIVMVRTPAQAEEVVLGDGGVLEHAPRGTLLAVMSTIGVACMRRLGAGARARGLRFLDAPVSGGRARAEAATLTVIVGGTAKDLADGRPLLEAMGSHLAHVGDVGAGTAVKMANQVLLTVSLMAAREVAAIVEAAGVSVETAWDVLRTCTGTNWVVENWPTASGWIERYTPGTSLDILVKDTGLALDLAREEGVPAPMLGLTSPMLVGLVRRLNG
ncbi:MAG: NAD(P)-dependent oxidoreductase [Bacillati bacterium ANGP1]|uniref:NAD(P)-dependent oxidoreductase n=1 Tax=Candidatus Segetimicrobium genomatis TaxID=2569760 RepID=A0A537LU50_9BACT|nr:MAG: NAD(P)-dependent oxidoreductase [Terrabacteria group bacterium ANGP1]